MLEDKVIRFATAQEKRRAEEQLLSAGAALRQKILAGAIEALRQSGFSRAHIRCNGLHRSAHRRMLAVLDLHLE